MATEEAPEARRTCPLLHQLLALLGFEHRRHVQPGRRRTLRHLVHQLQALLTQGLEGIAVQRIGLHQRHAALIQRTQLLGQRFHVCHGGLRNRADPFGLIRRTVDGLDHIIDALLHPVLHPSGALLGPGLHLLLDLRGLLGGHLALGHQISRLRRCPDEGLHAERTETEQAHRTAHRPHHARTTGVPHRTAGTGATHRPPGSRSIHRACATRTMLTVRAAGTAGMPRMTVLTPRTTLTLWATFTRLTPLHIGLLHHAVGIGRHRRRLRCHGPHRQRRGQNTCARQGKRQGNSEFANFHASLLGDDMHPVPCLPDRLAAAPLRHNPVPSLPAAPSTGRVESVLWIHSSPRSEDRTAVQRSVIRWDGLWACPVKPD